MNSLRARLLVGSSLIAVVPLAIAIVLLSRQIEGTMRAQAAERLDAALGGLRAQLERDGEATSRRIRMLAGDPQLRRLYLVRPADGVELREFLAERRFLLGLDLLRIADAEGVIVADGGDLPLAPGPASRMDASGGMVVTGAPGDSALTITARAPVMYQGRPAGELEGGLRLDRAYLARLRETGGVDLVLSDPTGRPVAGTLTEPMAGAPPPEPDPLVEAEPRRLTAGHGSYLARSLPLGIGSPPYPWISGFVSTAANDATIATLQWTAGLLGALGLALATVLALLWSSQVSRPVERLAEFSDRMARGEWDRPLALAGVRELQSLAAALDRMRSELQSQRDRLATSERQAAWGQMARRVAHEVRNPLTPIAVSVADLKRSYDLGRPEFPEILAQAVRTIGDEIERLQDLLRQFSDLGNLPPPRLAACRIGDLFSDLETLYAHEITAGRLEIAAAARELWLTADAGQLRQALVNLIKNGLEAVDAKGRVAVSAEAQNGQIEITVSDTGPELTEDQRAHLFVPGFTTKPGGSGLGLTMVERIVNDHLGTIRVESGPHGSTFRLRIPRERHSGSTSRVPDTRPRT